MNSVAATKLTVRRLLDDNVYLGHLTGGAEDEALVRKGLETARANITKLGMVPVTTESGAYYAWLVPDLASVNPFTIAREQERMSKKVGRSYYGDCIDPSYYGSLEHPISRDYARDEDGALTKTFGYCTEDVGRVFVLAIDPGELCKDAKVIGGMFGNKSWLEHKEAFAAWKRARGRDDVTIRCIDAISHHSMNTHAIASGDKLLGAYGFYDYVEMPVGGAWRRPYGFVGVTNSVWLAHDRSERASGYAVAVLVGGNKA